MHFRIPILLIILIFCASCSKKLTIFKNIEGPFAERSALPSVISFGSCNKVDKKQPLWDEIIKNEPDLWIWLGDIVYADTEDMNEMKTHYDAQKSIPSYQQLRKDCQVIGIYDDHDYGVNNGGHEFPKRKESRDLLFNFLDVPANDPAWQHEGAYSVQNYKTDHHHLKVIMLDGRYFREDPPRKSERESSENTYLGENQWQWLEDELTKDQPEVLILGSGIQVIPVDHPFEKWANFPNERNRLLTLLEKSGIERIIIISGDRHLCEMSRLERQSGDQFLYEVTSSGMTHCFKGNITEKNKHRLGRNFGKLNFGLIRIDWDQSPPHIQLELRGLNNELFSQYSLP